MTRALCTCSGAPEALPAARACATGTATQGNSSRLSVPAAISCTRSISTGCTRMCSHCPSCTFAGRLVRALRPPKRRSAVRPRLDTCGGAGEVGE